jgi:hypothetical protein
MQLVLTNYQQEFPKRHARGLPTLALLYIRGSTLEVQYQVYLSMLANTVDFRERFDGHPAASTSSCGYINFNSNTLCSVSLCTMGIMREQDIADFARLVEHVFCLTVC